MTTRPDWTTATVRPAYLRPEQVRAIVGARVRLQLTAKPRWFRATEYAISGPAEQVQAALDEITARDDAAWLEWQI